MPRPIRARSTMRRPATVLDRKSTRLNSSHTVISYAVFCLKKKKKNHIYQLVKKSNEKENRLTKLAGDNKKLDDQLGLPAFAAMMDPMGVAWKPMHRTGRTL